MADIIGGKKLKIILMTLLALEGFTPIAGANSYVEMITTAPDNVPTDTSSISYFDDTNTSQKTAQPLWYDTRITTPAPVVFSSLPKYIAWQQAKARENTLQFDSHEFMQDLIYNVEGGLAIWGLYEIYKYR